MEVLLDVNVFPGIARSQAASGQNIYLHEKIGIICQFFRADIYYMACIYANYSTEVITIPWNPIPANWGNNRG